MKSLEETFGPIENVYIDLRYMQDFYLGAILALCKSKDEIQYVIDNISCYNGRFTEDVVETVFSKLHLLKLKSKHIYTILKITRFFLKHLQ